LWRASKEQTVLANICGRLQHQDTEDKYRSGRRRVGAAAIAAVGCGLWKDFNKIDDIHKIVEIVEPVPDNNNKYEKLLPVFEYASDCQANISEALRAIEF